jgi:hypothetical protein
MKYYSLTAHRNACALLAFLLVAVAACSAKSTRDVTAGTPTPQAVHP